MELNVVATLRIMPADTGVDLDSIRDRLRGIVGDFGELHETGVKPIAFGLNSLEAVILLNDDRGGIEEIESRVKELEGVGSVEVTDVNRL